MEDKFGRVKLAVLQTVCIASCFFKNKLILLFSKNVLIKMSVDIYILWKISISNKSKKCFLSKKSACWNNFWRIVWHEKFENSALQAQKIYDILKYMKIFLLYIWVIKCSLKHFKILPTPNVYTVVCVGVWVWCVRACVRACVCVCVCVCVCLNLHFVIILLWFLFCYCFSMVIPLIHS